jgi:hypothetical protein
VNGKYGQAINFLNTAGSSTPENYFKYTIPSVILTTSSISISTWVNTTTFANYESFIGISTGSGSTNYINIGITGAALLFVNSQGDNKSVTSSTASIAGTWYHTSVVISSGTIYFYINGLQIGSFTSADATSFTNLFIGCINNFNAFNGSIQDLRIYNTALSAAQIYGIYQSQGIPPRLTMVPSTGGVPSPQYAWQFDGTLADSVQNLAPAYSNINGVYTTAPITWPFYDSTGAKYGTNSVAFNLNTPTSQSSTGNCLAYSIQTIPISGGGAQFSIMGWVKLSTISGNGTLMFLTNGGTNWTHISINPGSSLFTLGTTIRILNGDYPAFGSTLTTGTWYHVAVTANGSNMIAYFNGSQSYNLSYTNVGSNAYNTFVLSGWLFGAPSVSSVNGYPGFFGELDDVRIYNNQALSSTQIQTIYNSGGNLYGADTAQPSLLWSFNGNLTDSITGLSGSALLDTTAPATPTAGTVSYASGKYGQSLQIINAQTAPFQTGNNYVYWTIPTSLQTVINRSAISVSMWVNFNSFIATPFNQQTLFVMPSSVQSDGDFRFEIYPPNINFVIWPTSGLTNICSGKPPGGYLNNTWYNIVGTFSSSTGTVSLYVNGSQVSTNTWATAYTQTRFTAASLGRYPVAGGYTYMPFSGLVQDLRFYKTALSNVQIQAIYQSGAIPPSLTLTRGPTYPLAQTSIVSSALGLYSTRALVSTYTGPVVQVRRNSDNTTYNFIADIYGNLSNVQNSTSMDAFLSTTTGNVATWYDQSGAGKDFTQATAVSQPQLVLNSGQWVLWFNRDATPTFYASMTTASSITGVMTILYNYNMSTAFNAYTTLLGANGADNNGFKFTSLNVFGDAAGGNRVASDFLGTNGSYCYLNNSYGQMVNETTGTRTGNQGSSTASVWNQVIGTQGRQSFSSPYFNSINAPDPNDGNVRQRRAYGYLSEMMLFSAPINSADAQTLWARTPLTNPLPTKTTSG